MRPKLTNLIFLDKVTANPKPGTGLSFFDGTVGQDENITIILLAIDDNGAKLKGLYSWHFILLLKIHRVFLENSDSFQLLFW